MFFGWYIFIVLKGVADSFLSFSSCFLQGEAELIISHLGHEGLFKFSHEELFPF